MWTIFLRTIKDRKVSIIVYCLASIAFLWMYIGMYPSIADKADEFKQIMDNYPEAMMKAFNLEELSFDTLEKFLAMENFSLIWPIMTCFMMISLAGASLAGEIEKGTAEILLSKPISRIKLYFSKYLAGIFVLSLFTAVSFFSVMPLAKLYNINYDLDKFLKMMVIAFLFGTAVFSVSMMFSAIFSERGRAYMIVGGALILSYVLNIISALKENLANLKYFSFFYYYDQNKALIHGELDEKTVFVFLGLIVVSTIIGVIVFKKRDIAV